MIKEHQEIKANLKPKEPVLDESEKGALKDDMKKARAMNVITKPMPTQNVRDIYRAKCGFAPCVVYQLDAALFQTSDAQQRYFPAFNS